MVGNARKAFTMGVSSFRRGLNNAERIANPCATSTLKKKDKSVRAVVLSSISYVFSSVSSLKNAEKVLSSEGKTNSLPALQAEYSHQISAIAVMIIGYKSADNICRQVFFNRF